ncbi:MAG: glycosyltransferase [Verrucomicrobia bacterium]|nr:glycosyltransferase [Verrucomicrobiota bacterium]
MSEHNAFHSFIDQPTSWRVTAPSIDIRGWVYAKNGEELTDVRAKLDGVITYGIMGLDRPDLEDFFKGGLVARRSGFRVTVRPWLGARLLTLEALRPGNVWTEFLRTEIETSGTEMPARRPRPVLRTELIGESLYYLYRHFHFEPHAVMMREARRVLGEITVQTTEMRPENDLVGFLDLPQDWVNAHYEKFRVSGWAFSMSRKVSRLVATVGAVNENRLIWGKEREDVLRHNPDYPQALHSAFYGLVDVRPTNFSPACLKIFVEYPDGPRQLLRSKRLFLNKIDENSGPIAVFSETKFARCVWGFLRGILAGGIRVESWPEFWREVRLTRQKLAEKMIRGTQPAAPPTPWQEQDPYTLWRGHNRLTPRLVAYLTKEATRLAQGGPRISIVVPAYNTPAAYLTELIDSVRAQIYPNWELCVADDASPQGHVRKLLAEAARQDARIKYVVRPVNGHISAATNSALELATGEFIAFVDHDDVLPADALFHVAEAIAARPEAEMVYTDEDKIDEAGRHYDPQFKGDWSPEMALTHNYTHHLTVIRTAIVKTAGRLRLGYEGAQDIDLILRCVELMRDDRIVHVPHIGYHWRAHAQSTASKGDQKGYLFDAARRAINDSAQRRGLRATAFLPPLMKEHALCLHQLQWDPALLAEHPVTIVIPTKNRHELLAKCVASLDRTVNWAHVRLIIVDDGSTEPLALELLARLEERPDGRCRVLRTGNTSAPFNYSRLVNLGTAAAETPLVLHLNNDIEAVAPGWLEDLVGWTTIRGVGVVGARLIHPDETLNHAGIWVGPQGGLAHAVFFGQPKDDFGYLFLPHAARNVSAVTGACLLTRTDLYRQLGGFDERDFQVAYNDVDYCLRAARAGFRTVYTPQATLIHLGSASRGNAYTETEHLAFVQRYPNFRDPFISEVVDYGASSFKLNVNDHRYARRPLRLGVAVVTHNLNLEGAPLFIFEYARYLAEQAGWKVRVFSPVEGPLRKKFEDAGLAVEVLDADAFLKAESAAEFHANLKRFAAGLRWDDIDLIVGNTMVAYWTVFLGQALGKPAALYIHESNTPRKFFTEHALAAPEVVPLTEQALSQASRVIFTARATRQILEPLNTRDNFRTLASWVDIERIERFAAAHDKRQLRLKYGLDPDATLVVNIGSVCQRKGQHVYIRAIDQLMKQHGPSFDGRGKIEFLMVGAREGLYLESIEQDIELMGLRNTRLFPETLDIYDWYRLADIFVCTSFEESFPRVLLESASFRIPIISTNVNGIPEMLVNHDEAFLIPAGDYHKLCAALKACLDKYFARDDKMVSMAFARMSRFYDARVSLPTHVAMAREAYFG